MVGRPHTEVIMRVRITRGTKVRGKQYRPGETATIPDTDAKALIQMGKAEPLQEAAVVEAGPENAALVLEVPGGDRRPEEFDHPVTAIDGIGPATAAELAEHGIKTVFDLAMVGGLQGELAKWPAAAQAYLTGAVKGSDGD